MEKQIKIGMNRTGIQMSPLHGPDMDQYALDNPPSPTQGVESAKAVRAEYVRDADGVGSVPIPGTGKGVVTTAVGKATGKNPEALIDKLGQRLAFERTGVRLYQALIAKVDAHDYDQAAELRADLIHICEEEFEHFRMLTRVIESMGADPTAQTPGADVSAVAATGLLQVITDPRTTLAQSLEAILTAELTDTACWEILLPLAQEAGHHELTDQFQQAIDTEAEHVRMVKKWLQHLTLGDATMMGQKSGSDSSGTM